MVGVDNPKRRGIETNIGRLQENGVAFVHGDAWCVGDFTGLPSGIAFHCDANARLSIVSGYTNPMFDLMDNMLRVFQEPVYYGGTSLEKIKPHVRMLTSFHNDKLLLREPPTTFSER